MRTSTKPRSRVPASQVFEGRRLKTIVGLRVLVFFDGCAVSTFPNEPRSFFGFVNDDLL